MRPSPANLIGGTWRAIPGERVVSRNPADPADVVWSGACPVGDVDAALRSAREASRTWARTSVELRAAVLRTFAKLAAERVDELAGLVADEIGKALWDAKQEASLLAAKVEATLDASPNGGLARVTPFSLPLTATREGRCLFRPHGVVAVLGPFNFPLHLPNGQIVPALLAGNAVVVKPSDKAPASGQALVALFAEALASHGLGGAGDGIVSLVQGGADVAEALASHEGVDAIAFTGSWPVGRSILAANLDRPGRVVALEMGGNNAAVVLADADLRQAAIEIARCAFVGAGQRCTCTRRLVVHEAVAERLERAIVECARALRIDRPRATPAPFMGPLVSRRARAAVLEAQARWIAAGAVPLLASTALDSLGPTYASPGVLRVESFVAREEAAHAGSDQEVFGPLLRVARVRSVDEAIAQANATRFGLAASIFTRDAGVIDRFLTEARAGCVNVNTGTAGASGKLPFGGVGLSGNHRPAGSFMLDSCAHAVAAMVELGSSATIAEGMSFDDAWIA